MEHFLINSSVCLFSLWLVYKLLLENVSWHNFKRVYLLGSLFISAVIPFLVVRTVTIPLPQSTPLAFQEVDVMEATAASSGFEIDWTSVLLSLYVIGVLIMAFRFIKNLYGLRIKSTDEILGYQAYTLVLRKLIEVPHSFLTRIYASINDYKSGNIPESVLQHEKAHLDQKHSWDILAIEILLIAMWFNPLLYLIKYTIKLNHEFLADKAVLANGVETKTYQETLLAYSSSSQNRALANTFNFPIIKKRFTIMKTHTTTASGLLRSLAIIPVLAVLVISCGQEEIVTEPEVIEIVEVAPENSKLILIPTGKKEGTIDFKDQSYSFKYNSDGKIELYNLQGQKWDYKTEGYTTSDVEIITVVEVLENLTAADIKEYNQLAKKYQQKKDGKPFSFQVNDETLRMQLIYNSMTAVQKEQNESYPFKVDISEAIKRTEDQDFPPPPPPTALEFIKENEKDLVYYIDDKKVSQSEAINNIEVFGQSGVEIGRDANGKKAIKIIMNDTKWQKMPPPPPPAGPNSPTQEEQIANGTLKIYINDKIATPAQLDKLAGLKQSDWKNIAIYPKVENGVRTTYFYGEGL